MHGKRIKIALDIRFHRYKNFLNWHFQLVKISRISQLLSNLPDYPSIAASPSQFVDIYRLGAKESLVELASVCDFPPIVVFDIREYVDVDIQNCQSTLDLKKDFENHGSDKGSSHEYYLLYAKLLKSLQFEGSILEIGLGTNDISTPSNMGILGRPGASLRTWISHPKISKVIGADIDPKSLFEEPGIKTFQLDQTSHASWHSFKNNIGVQKFDLVIDDGLHSPHANLVTISESIELLSEQGKIVIEDIHERHLPIWRIFLANLPNGLQGTLIRCRKAYVLLLEQK